MKKIFFTTLLFSLAASPAFAISIDWSGGYRIEYTEIEKPTLGSPTGRKAYGQHLLYLTPTIVPADGFLINARFDLLANDNPAYQNSQMGMFFGDSYTPNNQNGEGASNRQNMGSTPMQVSQVYLTHTDENATFKVGRMPYGFGLGMTHSEGKGMFDHWYDSIDMLSYRFHIGNVYINPMFGQMHQTGAGLANKYQVQMLEMMYDSEDTGSQIGVLFERKNASTTIVATDPTGPAAFYGGNAVSDYSLEQTSFILGREWPTFSFKIEGGFQKGSTGVSVAGSGIPIHINSYGIANEISYHAEESKWKWDLRSGVASGDDPASTDFEGFMFDRNYDVAFLLFNQRLGDPNTDFFRTNLIKDRTTTGFYLAADDETISNATYVSPRITYAWSDKLDLVNTFTYATLMNKFNSTVDMSKDLGIEWDIELVYKPRERVRWVNQVGWLFPGEAWRAGPTNNFSNDSTYGFSSKAAISF
ncbi:MAG: hypothetical protein V4736_12815 [Bdellovibrionota bacterium]